MKKFLLSLLLLACSLPLMALVEVTDLKVKPRWPWNGKVDITYSIASDEGDVFVSFSGYDNDLDRAIEMKSLVGDGVGARVSAGGPYQVTWDAAIDAPGISSSAFAITVEASTVAPYLVFSLTSPDSYSWRISADPPNLDDSACRTYELWMRRIPAGTFTVGSPDGELGREDDETRHQVTISKDFYISVFEVTQRQLQLFMEPPGNIRPSYFHSVNDYQTRPVENVSYEDICGGADGALWPASDAVDEGSVLHKLRAKTNYKFDLPTEAQWEVACRANTTTALNSGKDLEYAVSDAGLAQVARFISTSGSVLNPDAASTTQYGTDCVGRKIPNAWGLYDTHGNVAEWCRDWYGPYGTEASVDPKGAASGTARVVRGGSWHSEAKECRSAARTSCAPDTQSNQTGLRLVCPPPTEDPIYTISTAYATTDALFDEGNSMPPGKMKYRTPAGRLIEITADDRTDQNYVFDHWLSDDVVLADPYAVTTTFVMPGKDVSIRPFILVGFPVVVTGGSASQTLAGEGKTVTITAAAPEPGMKFSHWTGTAGGEPFTGFADANSATTTVTMPQPAPEGGLTLVPHYVADMETKYLVIDISGGPDAEEYPWHVTTEVPDVNDDTCRTDELWLRWIEKGTFMMGSPTDEPHRFEWDVQSSKVVPPQNLNVELQHQVTLTKDFYIGVFEVTQRQWELVMGDRPSYYNKEDCYATRPVEFITFGRIRGIGIGYTYPSGVKSGTFLGKLRQKTGLDIDLPTEAQWEFACRATTTTALNSGKGTGTTSNYCPNLNELGRYYWNSGVREGHYQQYVGNEYATAKVGSYLPNRWGLYDMHGNVQEWCLDWYDLDFYASAAATADDPMSTHAHCNDHSKFHVLRGGSYTQDWPVCRSAARYYYTGGDYSNRNHIGFRVSCDAASVVTTP